MAFGPTGDATCLRLCARLSIPANARACPHIKPSRRPFRLSALCSNRVEQLHWIVQGQVVALYQGMEPRLPLLFYGGRYRQLDATVHPAPTRGDLRLADELIAAYYE